MPTIEVRPFRRSDRDQLTHLVNSHAEAVVPGMGVSVSTVLSSLERQPGEFIEDPWVQERMTLVAEQADRIAAAAHLLRYFGDERAGTAARDVGEIHWLLFWPEAPASNPCWPDAADAADALIAACIRQLERWGVTRQQAGGELPVRGIYGVPEPWPHIRALYERAGFAHTGHSEIVYLARVDDLARPATLPIAGLSVRRSAGMNGTRLSAVLGDAVIGYIEVETLDEGGRTPGPARWLGRHRQSARHRAVPPAGRRDLAARAGSRLASAGAGGADPGLRLAGGPRSDGLRLCGLPGVPSRGRVPGAHSQ